MAWCETHKCEYSICLGHDSTAELARKPIDELQATTCAALDRLYPNDPHIECIRRFVDERYKRELAERAAASQSAAEAITIQRLRERGDRYRNCFLFAVGCALFSVASLVMVVANL